MVKSSSLKFKSHENLNFRRKKNLYSNAASEAALSKPHAGNVPPEELVSLARPRVSYARLSTAWRGRLAGCWISCFVGLGAVDLGSGWESPGTNGRTPLQLDCRRMGKGYGHSSTTFLSYSAVSTSSSPFF
jgi:hypothetical protein